MISSAIIYLVPKVRVGSHLRHDGILLIVFTVRPEILGQEGIQVHVLVLGISRSLLQESVGYLGVKDPVTVDLVLSNESARVFAKIVKHLDNRTVF